MKKVLSILFALIITVATNAQTIHWITFIDTTDPGVGIIDIYGRRMLYDYFIHEVNAALREKGYDSDTTRDFYGYDVTPENCKNVIEDLEIDDPDDIIVFYYIGHGVRPSTDSDYIDMHPYPQMCLAQTDEDLFIPLEWVDEQLSSKGARLSVTIGMCCNNEHPDVSIKEEPNFSPNYGPTYMSSNKTKRIQELFLNERGHIIATSSSPTQKSGCFKIYPGESNDPRCYRDRYTYAICDFFKTQLDKYNRTLTWDDFLSAVSSVIDYCTDHQQTPIHDIYLDEDAEDAPPTVRIKAHIPDIDLIDEIAEEQTSNSTKTQDDMESQKWINDLSNQLGILIDMDLSAEERIEHKMNLSDLFADDAIVKFLGQESEKVIDKDEASVFLGRLATSRRILDVVVVGGDIDSYNKIKQLKVKEIYRK